MKVVLLCEREEEEEEEAAKHIPGGMLGLRWTGSPSSQGKEEASVSRASWTWPRSRETVCSVAVGRRSTASRNSQEPEVTAMWK